MAEGREDPADRIEEKIYLKIEDTMFLTCTGSSKIDFAY